MQTQPLTMLEAIDKLKVSTPTLYKLINTKKLTTYKVGRRRYTTVDAINKLISDLENEARV
jgi:excisionase family DNA binding protein